MSIAGSKTSPAIYCINIIAMNPVRIDTPTSLSLRDRSIAIIAAAVVLALLYVGRDVLIPLVVAIMLSLLLTLLVRALRRVGLATAFRVSSRSGIDGNVSGGCAGARNAGVADCPEHPSVPSDRTT